MCSEVSTKSNQKTTQASSSTLQQQTIVCFFIDLGESLKIRLWSVRSASIQQRTERPNLFFGALATNPLSDPRTPTPTHPETSYANAFQRPHHAREKHFQRRHGPSKFRVDQHMRRAHAPLEERAKAHRVLPPVLRLEKRGRLPPERYSKRRDLPLRGKGREGEKEVKGLPQAAECKVQSARCRVQNRM